MEHHSPPSSLLPSAPPQRFWLRTRRRNLRYGRVGTLLTQSHEDCDRSTRRSWRWTRQHRSKATALDCEGILWRWRIGTLDPLPSSKLPPIRAPGDEHRSCHSTRCGQTLLLFCFRRPLRTSRSKCVSGKQCDGDFFPSTSFASAEHPRPTRAPVELTGRGYITL